MTHPTRRSVLFGAGAMSITPALPSPAAGQALDRGPGTVPRPDIHNRWNRGARPDLTLIQVGDLHGHLLTRPHLRGDGQTEYGGGLARIRTKLERVRASSRSSLLFNVGDTIQGGAEALYTRGEAMVQVLDDWNIDGCVPGNWDFMYGTHRYLELFGQGRWGAVAANLYYDSEGPYAELAGKRVLPAYRVRTINDLRVGVIGLTTDRGPSAGDGKATEGFRFTDGRAELPVLVQQLSSEENVDVVVVLSELGLAKNIELAERYAGIDVLLSSDMHEETPRVVRTENGTLVSEVGQDGTRLGQLDLQVDEDGIVGWDYHLHSIDMSVPEHPQTRRTVQAIRRPFLSGPGFVPPANPISGRPLSRPLDTVVGRAEHPLYRGNFTDHPTPGVVEGTSHNMLADALGHQAGAQIGIFQGFRYGTHLSVGDITFGDLNHLMPIGASVAKGQIVGQQLLDHLERSINGVLSPDLEQWLSGWVPAVSGVTFDLDPYRAMGSRVREVKIRDLGTDVFKPLDPQRAYTVGGYWFPQQPSTVAGIKISGTAEPVTDTEGVALDATDVVANYLAKLPATASTGRVRLLRALPAPHFGNREIQPLRGVPTITA